MIKTVIFDLDGTLIDSFPGIRASLRHAIRFRGSALQIRGLRNKIGPPISEMIFSIWPELDPRTAQRILKRFRRHYDRKGCLQSRLYPGIWNNLGRIQKSGKRMFLLTNKPCKPTIKILRHLKIHKFFSRVLCPDTPRSAFVNKKGGALLLKRKHGLQSGETILVGDSQDDWDAAANAGFQFGMALYGYGNLLIKSSQKKCFALNKAMDLAKKVETFQP